MLTPTAPRNAARVSAALLTCTFAPVARACTLCQTSTGEQVRAGLFGPDFAVHLAATLLPLPVLGVVVALIHFGVPSLSRGARKSR